MQWVMMAGHSFVKRRIVDTGKPNPKPTAAPADVWQPVECS